MVSKARVAPLNPEFEQAWRHYLRAHALLVRRLDAELRSECGLGLTMYDALVQLSEAPGRRLRMKDLGRALVYSPSGLTRLVDALEARGFVSRENDPADRRVSQVVLTKAGTKALRGAWPVHVRGVREHWADRMTTEQSRLIADIWGAVRSSLEGA